MRHGKHHSAKVKLAGLRKIIESDLTKGDKLFLINFVETYLPKWKVPQDEEEVMQDLAQIEMTWVERALEEGKQKGKQELLLHLMTAKFGPLPDVTIAKVRSVTDDEMLNTLSEQVLFAASLTEIILPDPE